MLVKGYQDCSFRTLLKQKQDQLPRPNPKSSSIFFGNKTDHKQSSLFDACDCMCTVHTNLMHAKNSICHFCL